MFTHCACQQHGILVNQSTLFFADIIESWSEFHVYYLRNCLCYISNSSIVALHLAKLDFLLQNLAGAILSLCEMGCLQHSSSLGKFSQRCLKENREKMKEKQQSLPFGNSTQTKHLPSETMCWHAVKKYLCNYRHTVNMIYIFLIST